MMDSAVACEMAVDANLCNLQWIRRNTWPKLRAGTEPVTLVDLFCGCGGLALGAWEAARAANRRLDMRLAVDRNESALSVFRRNFRVDGSTARLADVRQMFRLPLEARTSNVERSLVRSVGNLDLLMAGPPCQGHSDLNNHTRRDDPRNELYRHVLRAVKLLRPTIVIIENVPTVIHAANGIVHAAVDFLEANDYITRTMVVRAEELGLAQRRRRHILVAIARGGTEMEWFQLGLRTTQAASVFLEGLEDEPEVKSGIFYTPSAMGPENRKRAAFLFEKALHDLPDNLRPPCHRDNPHSYRSMYGRMHWDAPAQTITSGFGSMGQGRFLHPTRPRTITPHEAARLQGFPDFYSFDGVVARTELHEMIGNAVPPIIGANIVTAFLPQIIQRG